MSIKPLAMAYVEQQKYANLTESRDRWRSVAIVGWVGVVVFFCLAIVGWFG